jgi:hypothetical protein
VAKLNSDTKSPRSDKVREKKMTLFINKIRRKKNQVAWTPSGKELLPRRIRGIPGSIPSGMPLRTSQISRPLLMSRKPVRKKKKLEDNNYR